MIRRADEGGWLLIAQHDHALLSGELAEHFGNEYFATPDPRDSVIKAVSQHDCGWPVHDDEPTINADGLPLDVFESSQSVALKVWTASVERASEKDAYAGLLVSLHVLNLSVFATTLAGFESAQNGPAKFALIKFQQREIERQDRLRSQLGLRTEKPVHHGPPKEVTQSKEDKLTFNFRLLQAMDVISLAACCTHPPSRQTQDVLPQPGAAPLRLNLSRQGKDVQVDPWPFDVQQIELLIPACRVENRKYESDDDLRAALGACPAEVLTCRVIPGS